MFYPLMLLETTKAPFNSADFVFEPKYDGIRAQYSNLDAPFLYTRNRNIINKQFPEVLSSLSGKMVLDGEIITLDSTGKEDFEGIIKRLFMRKDTKISEIAASKPSVYHVFDILFYKDEDLRNRPLVERKKILNDVIADGPIIKNIPYLDTYGEEYYREVVAGSMEGMVAKKKQSRYIGKRSWDWQKIINWIEIEAIISGYTKKDHALVCIHPDGRPLGQILHGMSPVQREAFFKISTSIKTREDSLYVYLEPILKCKLKGRGITSKGSLRSGIFLDFIL